MKNRTIKYKGKLYKKCKNCDCTKEIENYPSNGYSAKGTKLYKPLCKYCANIINHNKRILKEECALKQDLRSKKYYNKIKNSGLIII